MHLKNDQCGLCATAQCNRLCSAELVIMHAASGREALTLCKQQSFDCIVLETDLPDITGFEVLTQLVPRVWQPDHAVVVLTRVANRFLWEAALKNGAQGDGDRAEGLETVPRLLTPEAPYFAQSHGDIGSCASTSPANATE